MHVHAFTRECASVRVDAMMLACVRARHRVDGRGKCERRLAAELCGEKNLARVLRPLHRRGWRAQGRAGSCAARQARKARQHARSHQAREHAACRAPTSGLAGGQPQARRRQGQRHSCWSRHVDEAKLLFVLCVRCFLCGKTRDSGLFLCFAGSFAKKQVSFGRRFHEAGTAAEECAAGLRPCPVRPRVAGAGA